MLLVSECIWWKQQEIIKRTRPEFNGAVAYFTSNTIVAADGSSQRSNESIMAKT